MDDHIEKQFDRLFDKLDALQKDIASVKDGYISTITDLRSDYDKKITRLETEMKLIRFIGGAVGLGVVALVFEALQRLL